MQAGRLQQMASNKLFHCYRRRSTAGTQQDEARGYEDMGRGEAGRVFGRSSLHAMLEESFQLALDTRCSSDSIAAHISLCTGWMYAATTNAAFIPD